MFKNKNSKEITIKCLENIIKYLKDEETQIKDDWNINIDNKVVDFCVSGSLLPVITQTGERNISIYINCINKKHRTIEKELEKIKIL